MPNYPFHCDSCGQDEEHFFPWTKVVDAVVTCKNCGGTLRKVFALPSVIVYHGSGEYAERALRGEEVPPGMTREQGMATARQMAKDRKQSA